MNAHRYILQQPLMSLHQGSVPSVCLTVGVLSIGVRQTLKYMYPTLRRVSSHGDGCHHVLPSLVKMKTPQRPLYNLALWYPLTRVITGEQNRVPVNTHGYDKKESLTCI